MIFTELKDLNAGDSLILAWKNDDGYWMPYNVIVKKGDIKINLVEPDDEDMIIPFEEFFQMTKGYDINGKQIINLAVFPNIESCQKWCDSENKINEF